MNRLVVITIVLFALSGCKKTYEEGPKISFRDVGRRISNNWTIDKIVVNGVDNTAVYMEMSGRYDHWEFIYFGRKNYGGRVRLTSSQSRVLHYARAGFSKDLETINYVRETSLDHSNPAQNHTPFHYGPIGDKKVYSSKNDGMSWQIVKLKKKKLTLETCYQGDLYRVEMSV